MPYSLTCADSGTDCPGQFTTESREELVEHVELHVTESHPGLELTDDQVGELIKTT